ncbi:MAG: tetratricopeptide repeat protein [Candidatus Eisenbacteria bacterium]|nr:tetratricopeptide repeat protein [Candidatus Eisenbacteria bacterium]
MKKTLCLFAILAFIVFAAASSAADPLTDGRQYLEAGKPNEAISVLLPAFMADPFNAKVVLTLGRAYFAAGKPDSAEIMAKFYTGMEKKDPEGYILAARAALERKRCDNAYSILKKGLKANKNNVVLLVELGYTHMACDSVDQAIVSFTQASQISPGYAPAYKGLGDAYIKLNAVSVAIMQFEEALRADSTLVPLRYALAKLYFNERRFNEAADAYKYIIIQNPEDDDAARELGLIYYLADQFDNAASVLARYTERHPEDLEAWKMYTESLAESKKYAEAVAAADHVLKTDPVSPVALRASAKSQYMLKDYAKSISQYLELEQVDTLSADDQRYLGKAYFESGPKNDSLAILYMSRSAVLDSAQADIYPELGAAHMRAKNFAKAAEQYKKKFTMDRTAASAYVNYALCMEVLKNWEEARGALAIVMRDNPDYAPGHYHLGYVYSQMDSMQNAKKSYETFIALADTLQSKYSNELYYAYKFISVAYLGEKKYQQAEAALNKAVTLRPNDPEMHLWLAQTLHALNKREEARKQYQLVLKYDPGNKDAKKGLDILELYE